MFNSSVSGADDSAPVIYYSNTHYNATDAPILSNVIEHLSMPLINNQSNYLVSINKLKISDLSGVVLSYFPNDLQIGMSLSDGRTSIYKDDFLVKPNQSDEYISNYDLFQTSNNNDNIIKVANITQNSFVGLYTLPRVPMYCNFISLNNSLVYNDYKKIYSYDIGTLTESIYTTTNVGSISCSSNYNSNFVVCYDSGEIMRYDLLTANPAVLITVQPLQATPYRISTVSLNIDTIVVTWIDNADFLLIGTDSKLKYTKFTYNGVIIDSTQILASNTQCRKSLYSDHDKLLITALDGNPRVGAWYIPPIVQSMTDATNAGDPFTIINLLHQITTAPLPACSSFIGSYVYIPSRQQAIGVDTNGNRLAFINNLSPENLYTINFDNMTWYPSVNQLPNSNIAGTIIYPRYLASGIINNQPYNLVAIQLNTTQIAIWINILTPNSLSDPWQLYSTLNISGAHQPVNINTAYGYAISDMYFYLTIDSNNNIFLTFNQQSTPPLNAKYITVKLNTMTMTNGTINLINAAYTPTTIPIMLNHINLSDIAGTPPTITYNLMYDANTQIFMARNNNNLLYGYFDNILNTLNFEIGANMANINNNTWATSLRFKQCVNGMTFPNSIYPYTPYTTAFITYPTVQLTNLVNYNPLYKFNAVNISHNTTENFYTFNNNPNTSQTNYTYQGGGIFSNVGVKSDIDTYLNISAQYNTITSFSPRSEDQLAVYSLQEYIDAINNCLIKLYYDISLNGFTPLIRTVPFVSIDILTGYITMNYDVQFNNINNGIFVNDKLLSYMLFQSSPNNVAIPNQLKNKYILNSPIGKQTQTRLSFFKFNKIDKIIIVSNMSIISDTSGSAAAQNNTFTDLDLNLNDSNMLNLSGSFLYAAVLLRSYTLISNQQLRTINYQINIRYIDKSERPYYIPIGENVSIKFQFTRIY